MTIPVTTGTTSADVYTDFSGLAALKRSAKGNDPETLKAVAKQYESLFTRMMLKSMRDAVGKDPMFGSDEEQSYQDMYDDQLSLELSKGKGLGLADMLVRQMQHLTGGDKTQETDHSLHPQAQPHTLPTAGAHAALRMFQQHGAADADQLPSHSVPPDVQESFINENWGAAQEAGQQLGIDPRNLLAQAALETSWGTRVPKDTTGRSSNNLFGMKTGSNWNGACVAAGTQEYRNGSAVSITDQFRAYDSKAQSFQDYVALLRGSPRYAAALNTGSDTHAFASALQNGGYATDPAYAGKITAIAAGIGPRIATSDVPLKSASATPINPITGIL